MPGWRAKFACAGAAVATARAGTPRRRPTGLDSHRPGSGHRHRARPGWTSAPFDAPRQVLVPAGLDACRSGRGCRKPGWPPGHPTARCWCSVPAAGQVLRLAPTGAGRTSVLLDGLDQPHGLAIQADTLYVAESNEIDDRSTTAAASQRPPSRRRRTTRQPQPGSWRGLRPRTEERGGRPGRGGVLLDRLDRERDRRRPNRDPPRATIMRIPPDGGAPVVFATGVRNGTGLAIAPDGSVWTAVNNRDQVADPHLGPSYGRVTDYVNEHPPEALARLTPGRELGWPYCHPDIDGQPTFLRDVQTNADGGRLDCAALLPVEQTLGRPFGATWLELRRRGASPAVRLRRAGRGTRIVEPYPAGRRRFRSLLGATALWDRNRPWFGGSRIQDGTRWGRPVAAVVGPDGAVYITDDYAGAVYRLAPPGR